MTKLSQKYLIAFYMAPEPERALLIASGNSERKKEKGGDYCARYLGTRHR
jgi:hypothetical protein